MIRFNWNGYDFKIAQYGQGIFKNNMAGHSHSVNSYELHYITDGEGTLVTDCGLYKLNKNDFFITGPSVYHEQLTNKENPMQEIHLYIQTSGKKTNNTLVSAFLNTKFYYKNCPNLALYFNKIIKEENSKLLGYESVISATIQELMTEIVRIYIPNCTNISTNTDNLNDKRILIIENEFIENAENITLETLSNKIGVCERQAQRLLKKYYSKTFTEKKEETLKTVRN